METIKQEMLDQLEKRLTNRKHAGQKMNIDEWEAAGEPYMWSFEHNVNGISLLTDSGHGLMALFVDDVLHDIGYTIVVAKNREYIGLHVQNDEYGIYKSIK